MRKNTGFTLVEVLVAVALTGVILMTGYSAFQRIMQAQARLGATIDIQKNLFYTNEKLATLIRGGGTIDYEEYFNRRMLGYTQGTRADGIYTFTMYSHFGNGDVASRPPIYFCGVSGGDFGEGCMAANPPNVLFESNLYPLGNTTPTTNFPSLGTLHRPYGQYAALAFNYRDAVGYPVPIKLPNIFLTGSTVGIFKRSADNLDNKVIAQNTTDVGLPELYLIKKNLDNTYDRTYFRHVYVRDAASSVTCNPLTSAGMAGCLGKIQITKLTSCDTLIASGAGGSDGIIDAWIPQCDFNATIPSPDCSNLVSYKTSKCPDGMTITAADIYKSARENTAVAPSLPATANLAWVDVTSPDMNVVRAAFLPSPLKIPAYMSGAGNATKAAQVSLYLEVNLSTRLRNKSFVLPDYNFPRTLITTYDLSE